MNADSRYPAAGLEPEPASLEAAILLARVYRSTIDYDEDEQLRAPRPPQGLSPTGYEVVLYRTYPQAASSMNTSPLAA